MMNKITIYNLASVDSYLFTINPNIGLFYSLVGTWKEDATLCGSETILKSGTPVDDASAISSARALPVDRSKAVLAVCDSRGRVKCWANLKLSGYWGEFVALCSRATPKEHLDYLDSVGVKVIVEGEDRVDLVKALAALERDFGAKTVRVDSGGTLNGVLLGLGLVDEVSLLVQPVIAGGDGPSFAKLPASANIPLELISCQTLEGGYVWLRYRVLK
ncbi:MAG TPA: dihydrofolate reductase family protein [Caldisericia bacterium]|nr:MAG: 2,5-diamino-6-ribosylamino-4(3H)-pyrimidinone 5'-phosphate reductase [bacterium ADurb.Bin132]HNY61715.1 dihydrofolate reductase family protein [Caldisericia bacterium]HOC79768.1 dihydrofolate reductase family protein [Caldisericia bacterium]HOG70715.1 dihydrofolate reductase family protein [Caldisericia bacterium]HPA65103.1 dihydrofolate reductase family protein [Caldisericia bacterium]